MTTSLDTTANADGTFSFSVKAECNSCKGTGLYIGMGEKNGAAVVCHTCKGEGCTTYSLRWRAFDSRKKRPGVLQVVQTNPGIGISPDSEIGGMSYQDWLDGRQFMQGMEMRQYVCPGWWYQLADYSKKPQWDQCIGVGAFRHCKNYDNKAQCWARFDKENL